MDEFFLHYLWRYQKFNNQNLQLVSGSGLTVFSPGFNNQDSGPDFSEARIKINEIIWSGSIEVHYKASDWYRHSHDQDPAYQNVILHVVWSADQEVLNQSGEPIPTLELSKYAPVDLEKEYRRYINQPKVIRCSSRLNEIHSIQIAAMLDKAFAGRLKEKISRVLVQLKNNNYDWEETSYQILARNFGFKTNSEPFERLAQLVPYKLLKKHLDHPLQVEALIYGAAGFLQNNPDTYSKNLANEFDFLSKKYGLNHGMARHHWKFSKLRPKNFPTIRLAQFIGIILGNKHLFQKLLQTEELKAAKSFIQQPMPKYWREHYDFGKVAKTTNRIGLSSIENIVINSVVPLLGAYAKHMDNRQLMERAERLLTAMKSEQNKYIKKWISAGITPNNAKDSQALLFQYHHFCEQKKCLQCNIGLSIIGS